MDRYYKTEDRPLEPHELRKLKQGIWVIPFFLVFFVVFFVILFNFVEYQDGFFFWVPVGFAIFFALIMGYIIRGFLLDLRYQTKEVFQGLITRKEWRRSGGKSKSTTYYFYFGEKRMRVELNIYGKFEEGDLIEIHRSRRLYNMIYKTELLKRGVEMQQVAALKQEQLSKQQRVGFIVIILFVVVVGSLVAGVHLGLIDW